MHVFKSYHPIVNFIYFVAVIGFSMFLMHPVCLGISLIAGFSYAAMLRGRKALRTGIFFVLPMMVLMALINPAFSHAGITILTYLPNGNPLTLESILYGASAAAMLGSVIIWFSCYNAVMTSDKFIYLFGKILPSLSLILSMTLRFIPQFAARMQAVRNAQRCIGRDASNGSILKRAKHGLSMLSILVTWALENAVETADSMKSRGYGLPGRTAFSVFTFDKRDGAALLGILSLGAYCLWGQLTGKMYFRFYPSIKTGTFSLWESSVFLAYAVLCILPVLMEWKEVRKWKAIESKM